MKNKKIKIIESIILIVILISLIIIIIFAKITLSKEPKKSNTNEIKNYSVTKIIKYNSNISESFIYQIPYQDRIITEQSELTNYITATDNIINTYTEKILIYYLDLTADEKTIVKNFCNTYDIIEYEYKFQCTFNKNILSISNQYNIKDLNTKKIKNNHNKEIPIPIEKNTRLNDYIEYLNKNMISTIEVDEIK